MRTIDQTADRIWSDERPLERRQRGTQQRKRCSPSAPPLPRARPSPSTDARSRRRDPSPSAPARYAPPFSFSFVAFVARSLGERVISHQSRPYVPRAAGNPRRRAVPTRAERARVRGAKRRVDFFHIHPDRDATAVSRTGATRARRASSHPRAISRIPAVLSAREGSVGVGDPGASRRAHRVAAFVGSWTMRRETEFVDRAFVRSVARVGGPVRDARRWMGCIGFD